ncbi:MAG: type II secretion system protein N [Burkholderiaceae bacterium]|nr:type II secretion system protein N [Burkholderiaceae bacterium]
MLRLPALRRPRPTAPGSRPRREPGEQGWGAAGARARRWAIAGAVCGALLATVLAAPARWLAAGVEAASGGHLLLADARGSLWRGDAVLVLTAGTGSREARALPGRLRWSLAPAGAALRLGLQHEGSLNGEWVLNLQPGWGRLQARLEPGRGASPDWVGHWPAAWLVGLGTPWNTLQPGGALRMAAQGLTFDWVAGRFALQGRLDLELRDLSSRLSTLPRLGSYRLSIVGDPARPGTATVDLTTLDGALQLSGSGQWGAGGLRLRGEARAAEADQAALNNLLNIIGRRDGARSLLSIG